MLSDFIPAGGGVGENVTHVFGRLVVWCTHTKKVGGVYIYSSIAYDSRRGCGYARVQWGGHSPAHERTTHIRLQVVWAIMLARFQNGTAIKKLLLLLSSVMMIVINPAHKVACLFFNQTKNVFKIIIDKITSSYIIADK